MEALDYKAYDITADIYGNIEVYTHEDRERYGVEYTDGAYEGEMKDDEKHGNGIFH